MKQEDSSVHRVLIVGGGVAGLEIASTLGRLWRKDVKKSSSLASITLIDSDSAHVWKPLLHTIAAGTRDLSQQQTTYISQARNAGFTYQPGEFSAIDRSKREIEISPIYAADGRLLVKARRLNYDTLIIALGSQSNDFGIPGVADYCWKIDSRLQADGFNREIRSRIFECIAQEIDLPIVIVGGGATGVELAAELVQLTEYATAYGAQGLRSRVSITLIESGSRLLASFHETVSISVQSRLEKLGIRVLTESRVIRAEADGFVLSDGNQIKSSIKIWAAGIKAPDFLASLDGLLANQNNQLMVKSSLQTTEDENIYAIGDCSNLVLKDSKTALPSTAQVAHQQAKHLIRYLPTMITKQQQIPDMIYRNFGGVVSLGTYDGFGSIGKFGFLKNLSIQGRSARIVHALLYRSHQVRIHGFWRGGLFWFVDLINSRIRNSIRLD